MNKFGNIRKIKDRITANNKVYTPFEAVKKLIEMAEIKETDIVLDPSRGIGVFCENLPPCSEIHWCEIENGVEFFEFHAKVNIVIGNPMSSIWNRWLKHSISLKPRKVSYVFGMLNLTPLSFKMLQDNGYNLTKLHMSTCKN